MVGLALVKSVYMLPTWTRPVRLVAEHAARPARAADPLAAAVFRRSAESVTVLPAGGADQAQDSPSAIDTAAFFDLPDMLGRLRAEPTG